MTRSSDTLEELVIIGAGVNNVVERKAGALSVDNVIIGAGNGNIVESLVGGAKDALVRHGASPDAITVVRVPGAWEIPILR